MWTNTHFEIEAIVRNASVKHSVRFTANTRVVGCVVIKDRNVDVFMPQ